MFGFVLLCLIILFIIDFRISLLFVKIKMDKGYRKTILTFLACLILGPVGWIYVAALPDLELRKQNRRIIDLLKKY